MTRLIPILILLIAICTVMLVLIDRKIEQSEAGAVMVSFGGQTCAVRVGECGTMILADGTCIYFARLAKPLVVKQTEVMGK